MFIASAFDKVVTGWNVCKVFGSGFDSMFDDSGQPSTNLEPPANGACIDCPTNTFSGSTFTFTAQPAGLSNYDWNFGDGSTGSGLNVTHTYSNIGTYYVTLNCTDTCGGSYSVLDTVSTCPALNANFSFNIASSGSNGMLVQFFANVSGSLGLIWDWGDGSQTVTQAASISHQYAIVNLNYTITLKAYNECGDTVEIMKSLNEVGLPEQSVLKFKTYPM